MLRWPCKISNKEENKYLVAFYGTDSKEKFAWIKHEKYLKKFSPDPPVTEGRNYSSYNSTLKKAIALAQKELNPVLEEKCYVCNKGGLLILCDGCSNGVHQRCEGLKDIPEGEFFCSECSEREEQDLVYYHNNSNIQIYSRVDPLQKIFERSYWEELDFKDRKELSEVSSKYKYSSRVLLIRYKYYHEANDAFRVIKLQTTDNEISGAGLRTLLDYDNAKPGQVRYYDDEDDGFLLLRENKIFRFSEKEFFIKLMIIV